MNRPRLSCNDYLSGRIDGQLKWLTAAAKKNKTIYHGLRLVQIICGAFVAVAGGYAKTHALIPVMITICGLVISIAAGIDNIGGFQKLWITYRQTAEKLKREKYLFLTGTGPYQRPNGDAASDDEALYALFVSRAEQLLGEDVDQWADISAKAAGTDAQQAAS
jgi:Protein of unknown function (DUF4231)